MYECWFSLFSLVNLLSFCHSVIQFYDRIYNRNSYLLLSAHHSVKCAQLYKSWLQSSICYWLEAEQKVGISVELNCTTDNVCFKKTGTKHSSVSLLRFVPVFWNGHEKGSYTLVLLFMTASFESTIIIFKYSVNSLHRNFNQPVKITVQNFWIWFWLITTMVRNLWFIFLLLSFSRSQVVIKKSSIGTLFCSKRGIG